MFSISLTKHKETIVVLLWFLSSQRITIVNMVIQNKKNKEQKMGKKKSWFIQHSKVGKNNNSDAFCHIYA